MKYIVYYPIQLNNSDSCLNNEYPLSISERKICNLHVYNQSKASGVVQPTPLNIKIAMGFSKCEIYVLETDDLDSYHVMLNIQGYKGIQYYIFDEIIPYGLASQACYDCSSGHGGYILHSNVAIDILNNTTSDDVWNYLHRICPKEIKII